MKKREAMRLHPLDFIRIKSSGEYVKVINVGVNGSYISAIRKSGQTLRLKAIDVEPDTRADETHGTWG